MSFIREIQQGDTHHERHKDFPRQPSKPMSKEQVRLMNAYWRAANYLFGRPDLVCSIIRCSRNS